MRRATTLTVVMLATAISMSAGQRLPATHSLSMRAGSNMGVWDHPAHVRVGAEAHYSIPRLGPLEFYPAMDVIFDGDTRLHAQASILVRPLGRRGVVSSWYLGGGAVIRGDKLTEGVFSGIELVLGRASPYLEACFWGPVHAIDGEVELVAGFKFRLR